MARGANMGFNIDAEEADRLDLSLDVIEAVLADPRLAGWDGFGVVVQAYGPRAGYVIDWVDATGRTARAARSWCGWSRAPIGTPRSSARRCWASTASRSSRARPRPMSATSPMPGKLLDKRDRIYPQFATHNAHTTAAVLHLARELGARKRRVRVPAPPRHGRAAASDPRRRARHQDAHLRAGRPPRGSPRLSRAPPARERRQRLLRQHDRRPRRARPPTVVRRPVRRRARDGQAAASRCPPTSSPRRAATRAASTSPIRWPSARARRRARRASPNSAWTAGADRRRQCRRAQIRGGHQPGQLAQRGRRRSRTPR